MTKKFNVFIYYISLFIYILDTELSFKFNANKNRDSGLPVKLEQLTMEKHYKVVEHINSFTFKIRNNQKTTLKLNSEELNLLSIHGYKYYSQLNEKYKSFTNITYYEIKENMLIYIEILNLFFFTRKTWFNKKEIKFFLEDGLIKQKQKVIYKLNQEYESEQEYKKVSRFHESKLINLIFLPNYKINASISKPDPEAVNIIKRIKSINVIDNKLVITG